MNRCECIRRVYELGFALDDLVLYLDTHPDCQQGLALFASLQEQYAAAAEWYEAEVGPLTPAGCSATGFWTWAESPAVWEVCD